MPIDVLFRGATVYDGTGQPGQRADVAIAGGRIVSVDKGHSVEPPTCSECATAGG
jgi:N-acyl-D-aspartate/D-glutamate deacylase